MRRSNFVARDAAARRIQNIYRQRDARRAQAARRRRFPYAASSSSSSAVPEEDVEMAENLLAGGGGESSQPLTQPMSDELPANKKPRGDFDDDIY